MRRHYAILFLLIMSCTSGTHKAASVLPPVTIAPVDTLRLAQVKDSVAAALMVTYAKTLLGTPYKFGNSTPAGGFDCSGFINYVFNHFYITVPRSSVEFTNIGTPIPLSHALPGDVILFTGTNSNIRTVGHMGLIVANDTSGVSFIHSSSGSENAVIITRLDDRYMARFVKVIRIKK